MDGNNILIKKQSKSETSSQIELTLNEKDKVEGIAVMSFSSVSRITMEKTIHCYYWIILQASLPFSIQVGYIMILKAQTIIGENLLI